MLICLISFLSSVISIKKKKEYIYMSVFNKAHTKATDALESIMTQVRAKIY